MRLPRQAANLFVSSGDALLALLIIGDGKVLQEDGVTILGGANGDRLADASLLEELERRHPEARVAAVEDDSGGGVGVVDQVVGVKGLLQPAGATLGDATHVHVEFVRPVGVAVLIAQRAVGVLALVQVHALAHVEAQPAVRGAALDERLGRGHAVACGRNEHRRVAEDELDRAEAHAGALEGAQLNLVARLQVVHQPVLGRVGVQRHLVLGADGLQRHLGVRGGDVAAQAVERLLIHLYGGRRRREGHLHAPRAGLGGRLARQPALPDLLVRVHQRHQLAAHLRQHGHVARLGRDLLHAGHLRLEEARLVGHGVCDLAHGLGELVPG
mmetsp:Transcript_10625/g.33047  ORF Transcript_10625/g.33047 Transcript_10625/m.33047 type:complete len:328 (+) Transcript_10625:677-1660(+)